AGWPPRPCRSRSRALQPANSLPGSSWSGSRSGAITAACCAAEPPHSPPYIHPEQQEDTDLSVPLIQAYRVGKYIAGQKLRGVRRYPLVLMLEPLFQCNLACAGCGKIDYPKEVLQKRLSVEKALRAVDECGAPMVSIPGGEPLIHKEMPQIVAGIVARRRFVYLCTNAILLPKHIHEYAPSPYLTFSIHLDGNREHHDES